MATHHPTRRRQPKVTTPDQPKDGISLHSQASTDSIHRVTEAMPIVRPSDREMRNLVTFGITMHRRAEHVQHLISSILTFYPWARITVADDSSSMPPMANRVRVINCPADCGLSAMRNALAADLKTPFMVLLEEDFVFHQGTVIEKLIDVMNHDTTIGWVGGGVMTNQISRVDAHDFDVCRDDYLLMHSRRPYFSTNTGVPYRHCDMCLNFGLIRRELMQEVKWREELKLGEHMAWFIDNYNLNRWRIAVTPNVTIIHDQSRRNEQYNIDRNRARSIHESWVKSMNIRLRSVSGDGTWLDPDLSFPNVIVVGCGHSGTRAIVKFLGAAGWSIEGSDDYGEDPTVRAFNMRTVGGSSWVVAEVADYVRSLKEPWCFKDPRMLETMPHWIRTFASMPRQPVFLLLTRGREWITRSYRRRGEFIADGRPGGRRRTVDELVDLSLQRYAEWPWGKFTISYERFEDAIKTFKKSKGVVRNIGEWLISLAGDVR
jgi:hypothetical protein